MTAPLCSTSARRRGDPMLGTAAPATRWLLVEHPGGWAPAALDSPGIDDETAELLHRTALDVGGRVVLIRRPGRAAGPGAPERRRWTVLDLDGRQQWGTWRRSEDLERAAAAFRRGPVDSVGGSRPDPMFLVCTHGRHDVCCALRGRPVAEALAVRWPEQTWECTHIGGDRFAANLLVVPDGTVYGGLDAASVVDVVQGHLAGSVDVEHLRGFSAHRPPVQTALAAVLRAHGPAAAADVRPGEVVAHGDEWRVEVLGRATVPARSWVTVRRTTQPAARLTCRAEADATALVWSAVVDEVTT